MSYKTKVGFDIKADRKPAVFSLVERFSFQSLLGRLEYTLAALLALLILAFGIYGALHFFDIADVVIDDLAEVFGASEADEKGDGDE